MNKFILTVLFFLVPSYLFASSSISFSPPVSDFSVVFLANLFGVVDGVLSGTGSQIMGSMFAVFNAAILALGGIIVMYTLMVSTMNTAHEGQMLGQKWSSIWIPVRATIGLALLIPKASGYCLMQVFVMWVVLQGVGAADAIWGAALSYLNRGGVIVQAQTINPASDLVTQKGVKVANQALNMLAGQVCMLGLETQLKNYRQAYINNPSGPCRNAALGSDMDSFCKTPVPDFMRTIDTVAQQTLTPLNASWTIQMPNIPSGFYTAFNGICGSFSWSKLTGLPQPEMLMNSNTIDTNCSGSSSISPIYLYQDAIPTNPVVGCGCTVRDVGTSRNCCSSSFSYSYCSPIAGGNTNSCRCFFTGTPSSGLINGYSTSGYRLVAFSSTPAIIAPIPPIINAAADPLADPSSYCATDFFDVLRDVGGIGPNIIGCMCSPMAGGVRNCCSSNTPFAYCMPNNMGSFCRCMNTDYASAGYSYLAPAASLSSMVGLIQQRPSGPFIFGTPVFATPTAAATTTVVDQSARNFSATELETLQQSRAIALQQMYNNLTNMARTIIGNAPALTSYDLSTAATQSPAPTYQSSFESVPFGVPYNARTLCTVYPCNSWNAPPGTKEAPLFSGTEFLNAINAYNGIMLPTLNLINQLNTGATAPNKNFIPDALSQGWIMAGAYFYKLLQVQGVSTNSASASFIDDTDSAMAYTWNPNALTNGQSYPPRLNTVFLGNTNAIAVMSQVETLIDGSRSDSTLAAPVFNNWLNKTAITETNASTVYGFVTNSLLLKLPGQPGISPLSTGTSPNFSMSNTPFYSIPTKGGNCSVMNFTLVTDGHVGFDADCFNRKMYDIFIAGFFNGLIVLFTTIVAGVIDVFIFLPMRGMSVIFLSGLNVIAQPGVNPIIALAQMGINYINFSGQLWMLLLMLAVGTSLIPIVGVFIFALLTMSLPLLLAWVGVMVSIGFSTAYYIPVLPYTIFVFGALSWLMAVVEAMVAAPIVALGVTHPEGHDAFGKGEAAIMILVNVFLRPSMMIIGYISGIILSFVGIWMLNAGYDTATSALHSAPSVDYASAFSGITSGANARSTSSAFNTATNVSGAGGTTTGYTIPSATYSDWAGMYAYFFGILTYTSLYLTIVQKSFTLISTLPDKVLRWIGGSPESAGQESAQWSGEVQKQHESAGKDTSAAQGQMQKQMTAGAMKGIKGAPQSAKKAGGEGEAEAS